MNKINCLVFFTWFKHEISNLLPENIWVNIRIWTIEQRNQQRRLKINSDQRWWFKPFLAQKKFSKNYENINWDGKFKRVWINNCTSDDNKTIDVWGLHQKTWRIKLKVHLNWRNIKWKFRWQIMVSRNNSVAIELTSNVRFHLLVTSTTPLALLLDRLRTCLDTIKYLLPS